MYIYILLINVLRYKELVYNKSFTLTLQTIIGSVFDTLSILRNTT